ncbi:hypothetical protein FCULG_00008205 [Fusarium culmorum]|uniref:Uncharacterized protein n=1 Tax=Fusarium culmorum TaxID=5516 RepID=A0A2T4H130_FUSCU|nr:hypothetical protein FCULG_00008205 [Fusarium culmorum]
MSAIITIIFLSGSHLLILLAFETRTGQLSKVAARTWGLSYADLQQRSKAHTLNGDDEPYVVADILFKIVAEQDKKQIRSNAPMAVSIHDAIEYRPNRVFL